MTVLVQATRRLGEEYASLGKTATFKTLKSFLEEVGRTVSDPEEVDDELRALCEALIASEGRLDP